MLKPNLHLEALSEFYTSNFVTERRNLKGNIEQKTIETNRNFLEIFGKITESKVTNEKVALDFLKLEIMERMNSYQETDTSGLKQSLIDGTCRPLKIRVEQVLGSQPGPNVALSVILKYITDWRPECFFNTFNMKAEQLLRYRQVLKILI
ncbi:oligomeric complex COG6 [Gigaspora margarita]|uniref:Conserved oligomeric Golgi complex subunit 6 n=1 Tax=Gigaspora margarita TaxID=4874 RepID=A0A8H4AM82_GIGMA|nr:oligomeric complex COG6 [Gigaspora margarita]